MTTLIPEWRIREGLPENPIPINPNVGNAGVNPKSYGFVVIRDAA